jgi:N-acetylglucosamine kinase
MLLAVDGGATKTLAVVFDEHIAGVGVAGSGNYNNVGVDVARTNAEKAVSGALKMAGCGWESVDRGRYGFAGVENSAATTMSVEMFLRSIHKNGEFSLFNDGVAAYYLSTKGKPGVIAAAGTGSVVQARGDGKAIRTGGWGWLAGDEGSAYYIARRGLQEATKAFDGRGMDSTLVDSFARLTDMDFNAAISSIYRNFAVRRVAALAPVVTACASQGDETALGICREAAKELALAVKTAKRKMDFTESFVIGGLGGVFRAGKVITDTFFSELVNEGGKFARVYYGYQVVLGSVLLDMKNRGLEAGEKETERLVAELDVALKKLDRDARREFLFME